MTRRLKAVLFDLDGTLYDRDALVREVFAFQWEAFQDRLPGIGSTAFVSLAVELDAHGYREKSEVYAEVAAQWGLATDLAAELEVDFWERYLAPRTAPQDTLDTLAQLRSAGLVLGLVTNGSIRVQTAKLDSLGLANRFDAVLISEAEGLKKPDPLIFHRALERCGATPTEAVFIGDHPEADVRGAQGAGLTAIWRRVPHWSLDDPSVPVVDSLRDVVSIVTHGTRSHP